MRKNNIRIHSGGKDIRDLDLSQAKEIGGPEPTILTPRDLMVEGTLVEGTNRFFAAESGWGTFSRPRDIYGVTILAFGGQKGWLPLPLAYVVVKVKPEICMMEQYTRADGTTAPLPFQALPFPSPLGLFVHAMIFPKQEWRLEVDAPGFTGAKVRVILHTVQADPRS